MGTVAPDVRFLRYHVSIDKDRDGWYLAEVEELPSFHTQAATIAEVLENLERAIRIYMEDRMGSSGRSVPPVVLEPTLS
jgi:predicted RNase H-like HicB family nuclease